MPKAGQKMQQVKARTANVLGANLEQERITDDRNCTYGNSGVTGKGGSVIFFKI
jgi:hypothetical protein